MSEDQNVRIGGQGDGPLRSIAEEDANCHSRAGTLLPCEVSFIAAFRGDRVIGLVRVARGVACDGCDRVSQVLTLVASRGTEAVTMRFRRGKELRGAQPRGVVSHRFSIITCNFKVIISSDRRTCRARR